MRTFIAGCAAAILSTRASINSWTKAAAVEFPHACAAVFYIAEHGANDAESAAVANAGKRKAIDAAVAAGGRRWLLDQMVPQKARDLSNGSAASRFRLGVKCIDRYAD